MITGGEPCLQPDLRDFIKEIKALGFLVKLDTNGSYPDVLARLLKEKLLDYVAMDIKAPFEKYETIVRVPINEEKIRKSIETVINSGVGYEFRTTVVKEQLTFEDILKIGTTIKGAKKYYLQKFVPTKLLDESLCKAQTYRDEEFLDVLQKLETSVKAVEFR